jgi:hypothetical protein
VTRLGEFKFFGDIFGVVFLKNPYVENIFRIPHFPGKSYVLIVTKNGLGYILGDFFTNSSGHPVRKPLFYR